MKARYQDILREIEREKEQELLTEQQQQEQSEKHVDGLDDLEEGVLRRLFQNQDRTRDRWRWCPLDSAGSRGKCGGAYPKALPTPSRARTNF